MSLTNLLIFVPLGFGIAWLVHLLFKANLATQPLGKIISYFVGVLIILLVIGVFIDFFPAWALERLQNTQQSAQWQQFIDTSTSLIDDSFDTTSTQVTVPTVVAQPTAAPVIQEPPAVGGTPAADPNNNSNQDNSTGPINYTVVTGDTLTDIANKYNTTVNDIMIANGLTTTVIHPGDVLRIPAATEGK